MAKKSQRRSVRYEKDHSGCMWGFISMFDFRHGRAAQKLIADKRRVNKNAFGSVHSKNKFDMFTNLDEHCEAGKPSVKKLMEEDMFIDKDAVNAEVKSRESRLCYEDTLKIDPGRKKKSRKKSYDPDTHDLNSDKTLKSELSPSQHSRQQSKSNLDLEKVLEDFSNMKSAFSVVHDLGGGEVTEQSNQKRVIAENEARCAILEFLNQMTLDGKDLAKARKFLCSHEFMDALQILSSDKELFLRLLRDPNSLLLKYVQQLIDTQVSDDKEHCSVTASNFSEHDPDSLKQSRQIVNHRQRNFFRKMVKSRVKDQTSGNVNAESSNRIVFLKPGPMGFQDSQAGTKLLPPLDSYESSSVRVGSHFSLTEIKKKLKHAMGKERDGNPEKISKKTAAESQNKGKGSKTIGKDNSGMKSPNKDHFFIEKMARPAFVEKKGDKNGTLRDLEVVLEHENGNYPKQRVSNIYVEAKKHLCEMLGNEDENMDFSGRKVSKNLGRILSLPEYNLSPLGSPGRDWEHQFMTARTRLLSSRQSPIMDHLEKETSSPKKQPSVCDDSFDIKVQDNKLELTSTDDLIHDAKADATCCPNGDEMVQEGNVESRKEINVLESSSEPVDLDVENAQICEISTELSDDAGHSQCLNQDVSVENQPPSPLSSPTHSSTTKKNEELESGAEIVGRPSPVSVLDTVFPEDDISPESTRFRLGKIQLQPIQIQFEEHDSLQLDQIDRQKQCVEENKLIFDYIKAILHASGFSRDQLWMRCVSSDQILDPSLSDQIEVFSNQPCHDQKLLFDCVNEVLMEVCQYYFGVSPCVSFVRPSNIRPAPYMKSVTLKVWEGVCWHLLPLSPPHTLDQIVRKDMARSGAWMDLRFDAEQVGFEMSEAILAELMEDTILSCLRKNLESTCFETLYEAKDKESSINV
ncbi:uncharacterized protein LOC129288499 [Prosopis cineraria]|uniref:uncharacterized protein LOC129288499 n=1 Tax=Prosopis cineraria TaxID=364024 RepID=UPI00240F3681|nr:uncharacterized protein LOC129288499 [Prosopis cineraria]XP_054781089.1 uncharacterized protein LOC129288499 [Prosopis cineraria]